MEIRILLPRPTDPPHKLAAVELVFEEGPLAGLKLAGFAVWRRREGGEPTVSFPARPMHVEGRPCYRDFLRPGSDRAAPERLAAEIRAAWAAQTAATNT